MSSVITAIEVHNGEPSMKNVLLIQTITKMRLKVK